MSVSVKKLVVGPIEENCYIVSDPDDSSKKCFLVDPGAGGSRIINAIKAFGLTPSAICLTHGHFDHIMAVGWLIREYPEIKVYACAAEKAVIDDPEKNMLRGMDPGNWTEDVVYLNDGDILTLSGMDVKMFFTPGHTEGSSCFYIENDGILFSGDTLFKESVGRTDFPSGNTSDLKKSIREKLMLLPEQTKVYPGHGDETTIGHEKKYNFIMFDF